MYLNRVGEVLTMNCGLKCEITEYINANNITVKFLETNEIINNCSYKNFKNKNIKSGFSKTVLGVGILDGVKTKINGIQTKEYTIWADMLRRCYSKNLKNKHTTYKNCKICEEWLHLSEFKKWFDENYYEIDGETMSLDKDILIKGNKVYSSETCIFVPQRINTLFTKSDKIRGKYPVGVTLNNRDGKFISRCNDISGNRKYLGIYNSELEAFNAYKTFKESIIKQVADEYRDKIPKKLYEAMYRYEVEITD